MTILKFIIITIVFFTFAYLMPAFAADLYFDANGTNAGFGLTGSNSPFTVNPKSNTWNTIYTGTGSLTSVSNGDYLHFGLDGTGGILFEWENYGDVIVGGIHTYNTNGGSATINRMQKHGGGIEKLVFSSNAVINTEIENSFWWDFSTSGIVEKVGGENLFFGDGVCKLYGSMIISEGNVIIGKASWTSPLNTVSSDSSFVLNGGKLLFADWIDNNAVTASIGKISGSGMISRYGSDSSLANLTLATTGFNLNDAVPTNEILLLWGAKFALASNSSTTLEIDKNGIILTNDRVVVDWPNKTLALDGELKIELLTNSSSLNYGDSFNLFSGNLTGTFQSVNLPVFTNGFFWDISRLESFGIITILPEPAAFAIFVMATTLIAMFRRIII